MGYAVGLSPLLVLVSVTGIGILLGAFYVLLAIPIAALLATLVDVIVRNTRPPRSVLDERAGERQCRLPRPARRGRAARYALRQRPNTRPPEREAEPEGADGERADRDRLARRREPLPASECLLLLGRQLLAAPLLAQRAAGPEAEVEVVEDFGVLVGHFRNL